MATRNLGQVAGLWIGTNPPTNTDLIWLDTSLNPAVHKVYANGGWNNLAQNIISTIGYANLKNLAQTTGLTLGSWYKITDNSVAYRNNVLAYAITSQRIHYVANNGNIVIDDLSSSSLAEFRVPCINNLLIDGITGDWSNNQLNFNFTEATPSNAADYFLFGKRLVNSVYQFAKFKISSFISTVTGNDLQWNNGLYINLSTLLNNRYDQVGGVTAYNTYAAKIALVDASLQTLSENYQHLISGYTDSNNVVHSDGIIDEKIADATSSAAIIGDGTSANPGKVLPSINTSLTSGMNDINVGDNLRNIISKCQGWFNNLKKATSINLTNTYTAATNNGFPAVGDTIQEAIQKIGYWLNNVLNHILPSNFTSQSHSITPGTSTIQDWVENEDFELNKRRRYDLVIKPDTSLKYDGLKQLETAVNSGIKSILVRKGTYNVVFEIGDSYFYNGHIAVNANNILTNNVQVVFEPGVVINVSNGYQIPFYESTPMFCLFGSNSTNVANTNSSWECNGLIIINNITGTYGPYLLLAFNYCYNISNVIMQNAYALDSSNDLDERKIAISESYEVKNCSGLITGSHHVDNCSGFITGCEYLHNCYGSFKYCNYLNSCSAHIASDKFDECQMISHCSGKFDGCRGLSFNYGTFTSCYVESDMYGATTPGTTAPANTAAGGYNEIIPQYIHYFRNL